VGVDAVKQVVKEKEKEEELEKEEKVEEEEKGNSIIFS
tara:strand:- start:645 stop:758 length:114 start_codon:yes stop_codon:yes gene_type:complete